MLDRRRNCDEEKSTASAADVVESVRALCARELSPLVQKIDSEGYYPEEVLRELGRLGAFAHHLPGRSDSVNLNASINAMAAAGEYCLSTSFCMWCQDAFAWYIFASANETLKTASAAKPRSARRSVARRSRIR